MSVEPHTHSKEVLISRISKFQRSRGLSVGASGAIARQLLDALPMEKIDHMLGFVLSEQEDCVRAVDGIIEEAAKDPEHSLDFFLSDRIRELGSAYKELNTKNLQQNP